MRKYIFTQIIINLWHSLPSNVANSVSVNSFKKTNIWILAGVVKTFIMTTVVILPELETEVQVTNSLYSTVIQYLLRRRHRGKSLRLLLRYDTIRSCRQFWYHFTQRNLSSFGLEIIVSVKHISAKLYSWKPRGFAVYTDWLTDLAYNVIWVYCSRDRGIVRTSALWTCGSVLYNICQIYTPWSIESDSLFLSRLDYCNAVLHGIPSCNILKLQRVQDSAARIVLQAPRRSHTEPLLRQLHWLPVQYRIKYKLAVLTYKVRVTSYLSRHIKLRDSVWTLRSAMTTRLSEPFASIAFAKRAFRCSAPATWNSLPRTATDSNSIGTFKPRLKTFLYSLAYNGYWH